MTVKEKASYHLRQMDIIVYAAEIKFGLPLALVNLVGGELAEKFSRQWQNLNAAIIEKRYADVCVLADGVCRGVYALEKAAFQQGIAPLAVPAYGEMQTTLETQKNGTGAEIKTLTYEFFKNGGDNLDDL